MHYIGMDCHTSTLDFAVINEPGRESEPSRHQCQRLHTTVSRTTGYFDEELRQYQTKPLTDDYPFLFLDGITQKVREIGVKKKVMLCALGMKEDGIRGDASFRMADSEDVDSWRAFLVDLKSRGLQGKCLKLITTDGNPALLKAAKEIYPFLKVHRSQAEERSYQAQTSAPETLHGRG